MNINIKTTYIYSTFTYLAFGIINSISSNLVYRLAGENFYVGLLGAIQGIVQMIVAIPMGVIADKMRAKRAQLLKRITIISCLGSAVTILAVLGNYYGLPGGDLGQYVALVIACIIWGTNDGCIEPVQEALFSDSISNGDERTKVESFRSSLQNLGSASGPLTSLIMFYFLGNHWSKDTMAIIWVAGIVPLLVATISICFYSDAATISATQTEPIRDPLLIIYPDEKSPYLGKIISSSSSLVDEAVNFTEGANGCCKLGNSKRNATLCIISDIICALGSGSTVAFWSLFFENTVKESPIALNLTLLASSLTTAAGVHIARLSAAKFGRVKVCFAFILSGVGLLIIIGVLHHRGEANNPWLMSILYIFRTALMNSTNPLFTAILMDNVPSESRGKWASFSSITTIGWTGSAVVGGIICDRYGYGVTFFITAILQACSLLPLLGLTSSTDK